MPMVDGSKTLCGTTSGLGMIHLHGTQTDCVPQQTFCSLKKMPQTPNSWHSAIWHEKWSGLWFWHMAV